MANVWKLTKALNNKLLFSLLENIKTQNCRNLSRTITPVALQTPKSRLRSASGDLTVTLVSSSIQEHLSRGRSAIGMRLYGSHYDNWTDIHYEDLIALMTSGDIQLIDVREPKELQEQGTFPNALNIPLSSLTESLKLDDAVFAERYQRSKPLSHHTNIVFVGYGPVKSNTALEMAHKLGYKKARQYSGGYQEWHEKQTDKA